MYTNKQRFAALLAVLSLVTVMFFSTLFLVKESNHHCSGQDCPICVCIHEVQVMIRNIGTAAVSVVVSLISPAVILLVCLVRLPLSIPHHTLISQKVRLND